MTNRHYNGIHHLDISTFWVKCGEKMSCGFLSFTSPTRSFYLIITPKPLRKNYEGSVQQSNFINQTVELSSDPLIVHLRWFVSKIRNSIKGLEPYFLKDCPPFSFQSFTRRSSKKWWNCIYFRKWHYTWSHMFLQQVVYSWRTCYPLEDVLLMTFTKF